MKLFFYSLAIGTLLTLGHQPAQATTNHSSVDSPAEVQRKAAAREKVATAKKAAALKHSSRHKFNAAEKMGHAMRVMLGLEDSRAVTSPGKLNRQQHARQRQLKVHARQMARIRRARTHR